MASPASASASSSVAAIATGFTQRSQNASRGSSVFGSSCHCRGQRKVHFGPAHTMMTTPYKEILVSNCGSTPITFTSGRIDGGGAASFAIVSQLAMAPLDPKGSTKVDVVMTPQSNGAQTAASQACSGGKTKCEAECVDLKTANNHCGACGSPCAGGSTCQNGFCSSEGSCALGLLGSGGGSTERSATAEVR